MTRAALVYAFVLLAGPAPAAEVRRDMVGTYRHTHAYTSGSFTAVLEQRMVLGADGTVQLYSNAAAGNAKTSAGPAKKSALVQRGTWSVEGKTVHLRWQTWRAVSAPFLFGNTGSGWTLAIGRPGSRKLWEKLR